MTSLSKPAFATCPTWFSLTQYNLPCEGANHVRPCASTYTGPLISAGCPPDAEYVVNTLSRRRAIPRLVPTHRFPSRSSNKAVTGPLDSPDDSPPDRLLRSASEETPRASMRVSPLGEPTHTLESRSLIITRPWTWSRAFDFAAAENSVPFQRTTPLSVPSHTSRLSVASRELIFLSGKPVVIAETRQ